MSYGWDLLVTSEDPINANNSNNCYLKCSCSLFLRSTICPITINLVSIGFRYYVNLLREIDPYICKYIFTELGLHLRVLMEYAYVIFEVPISVSDFNQLSSKHDWRGLWKRCCYYVDQKQKISRYNAMMNLPQQTRLWGFEHWRHTLGCLLYS